MRTFLMLFVKFGVTFTEKKAASLRAIDGEFRRPPAVIENPVNTNMAVILK